MKLETGDGDTYETTGLKLSLNSQQHDSRFEH